MEIQFVEKFFKTLIHTIHDFALLGEGKPNGLDSLDQNFNTTAVKRLQDFLQIYHAAETNALINQLVQNMPPFQQSLGNGGLSQNLAPPGRLLNALSLVSNIHKAVYEFL